MTQPSDAEIAKAREIVILCENTDADPTDLIARALHDAAKVKAGCVRTEDGVEHRVLGELAFTADGCLSGVWDGEIWTPHHWQRETHGVYPLLVYANTDIANSAHKECFSTKELALAAQRAKEQHEQD